MKQQTCKECQSIFHTAMYHKPRKPINRVSVKSMVRKSPELEIGKSKKVVKPKVKRVSRSQLVKKLDAIFSQYIRLRDDMNGCVTCGDVKPWKEMQNCHFYSRGRMPTRWDETNCHSGCYRCNVLLKGNYINYTMYMIDRYGRDYVDNLEIKSKSSIKLTTVELKEMIEKYRLLIKT